jgi:hypothetical protein
MNYLFSLIILLSVGAGFLFNSHASSTLNCDFTSPGAPYVNGSFSADIDTGHEIKHFLIHLDWSGVNLSVW